MNPLLIPAHDVLVFGTRSGASAVEPSGTPPGGPPLWGQVFDAESVHRAPDQPPALAPWLGPAVLPRDHPFWGRHTLNVGRVLICHGLYSAGTVSISCGASVSTGVELTDLQLDVGRREVQSRIEDALLHLESRRLWDWCRSLCPGSRLVVERAGIAGSLQVHLRSRSRQDWQSWNSDSGDEQHCVPTMKYCPPGVDEFAWVLRALWLHTAKSLSEAAT